LKRDEVCVQLQINDECNIKVKLHTGAQVSFLPVERYKMLDNGLTSLVPSDIKLSGYGVIQIKVLGKRQQKCEYKKRISLVDFFIIDSVGPPALSLKVCQDLQCTRVSLIKVVLAVNYDDNINPKSLIKEFSDVFHGQGCLFSEYTIEVKSDSKPVVHAA
jgi:hypothetical protein